MDDTLLHFEERMQGLRAGYVAGLPERLQLMRMAQRADDRAALQNEAHRLAGTGLSYGFPALSTWGKEVERKCKSGAPLALLEGALDELSDLIAQLLPGAMASSG